MLPLWQVVVVYLLCSIYYECHYLLLLLIMNPTEFFFLLRQNHFNIGNHVLYMQPWACVVKLNEIEEKRFYIFTPNIFLLHAYTQLLLRIKFDGKFFPPRAELKQNSIFLDNDLIRLP